MGGERHGLTKPCPNCGLDRSDFWCNGQDLLNFISTHSFEYRRCAGCHSLFALDPPTDDELGKYYPSDYGPYQPPNATTPSRPAALLARVLRPLVVGPSEEDPLERAIHAFYEPPVAGRSRLLDFGCGSPLFLSGSRTKGWSTAGADFQGTVVAALRAEGHEGFTVASGLDNLPEGTFDRIRMNHVIEHLQAPRATLAGLLKALKPGGRIHIATPNGGSLSAEVFKEYWLGLDAPRHLCIFTPEGLEEALGAAGFQGIRVYHECVSKDAVRSLGRVLARRFGGNSGFIARMSASQVNPPFLDPLARFVARMRRSDRIHAFAGKAKAS